MIELIFTLVILSVLLLVAVPNFNSVLGSSKVDKVRKNIASGLSLARAEAITRGRNVTMCQGSSGTTCGTNSGNTTWSNGWKVIVVEDDGSTTVIRRDDSTNTGVTTKTVGGAGTCGDYVTYGSDGAISPSGVCQFLVTDTASGSSGNLWVAATGRIRMD